MPHPGVLGEDHGAGGPRGIIGDVTDIDEGSSVQTATGWLSREDLDKIACWIDLLVPFCGDYTEAAAWSEAETKKYERFLKKRRDMEELERRNIAKMLGAK